jgi:hypothetical protein
MTTRVEEAWLDYAWSVVTCGDAHRRECDSAGGADPQLDPTVRYPGTLGSTWDDGRGVLFVSLVHRSRPDKHASSVPAAASDADEIIESIRAWRTAGRSPAADATFLRATREAHERTVPTWSLWKQHFGPVVSELGLRVGCVALTNLAKCRADLDADDGLSVRLAKLCQPAFPISGLVEALQPKAVLVASVSLPEDSSGRPGQTRSSSAGTERTSKTNPGALEANGYASRPDESGDDLRDAKPSSGS